MSDARPPEPDPFPADTKAPAADVRPAEIKKAPPASVDVAVRLAGPVARLELTDMPLLKAVELLAAMGDLPVTLDVDAMIQLGVTPRDPVRCSLIRPRWARRWKRS